MALCLGRSIVVHTNQIKQDPSLLLSLSPRCVAAGAGVGDGQEDALGVIVFGINETHYIQCLLFPCIGGPRQRTLMTRIAWRYLFRVY